MTYNEKIQYAEVIVEDIFNDKPIDSIKQALTQKQLSERDVNAVIKSAMFMIGEKLKPLIRTKLLAGEPIQKAKEFAKIDAPTLGKLVEQSLNAIALEEEQKVKKMLRNKAKDAEIYAAIRQDFYPRENITHQIAVYYEVKSQNSISSRIPKIAGGIGLMLLGFGLTYVSSTKGSGRGGLIFYGLVIAGIFMLFRGFQNVDDPY